MSYDDEWFEGRGEDYAAAVVQSPRPQRAIRSMLEQAKWPLFAALVAIAYLQYAYLTNG